MIRQFLTTLPLFGSILSIDAFLSCHHVRKTSMIPAASSRLLVPSRQSRYSPLHADVTGENDAVEADATEEVDAPYTGPEAELPSEDDSDILNSPAFLRRKVEVLETDLVALEKEIDEANAVYTAGKAEWGPKFEDLEKESKMIQERMSRQGQEGNVLATLEVVRKMLDVIDNYDRAFGSMEPSTDEEKEITDAYKKTYDSILDAFAGLNVTKVETVGAEFDYELHQAVMQLPSDEYPEGVVCTELAPGWALGDKLIRAAMVGVSAG